MPKNPIIIILADAFRHDYINMHENFFIQKCAVEFGGAKVEPSIGFCERTELLTGVPNEESGLYGAHTFDPEQSPYRFLEFFLKALAKLRVEKSHFFNRIIRRMLWAIVAPSGVGFHPANIPFAKLSKISLTEDAATSIMNTHPDSFFELGRRQDVSINTECFTGLNIPMKGDDKLRRKRVIEQLDKFDVHLLYQGDMDRFGHLYGPDSDEFKVELNKFDQAIHCFFSEVKKKNFSSKILFLGDHGMTSVSGYIDVTEMKNKLRSLNLKQDLEYFIDSTSVRIWLKETVKSSLVRGIESFLQTIPNTERVIRETLIPNQNVMELRLLAKPGFVFTPDFFSFDSIGIKGMHGYNPQICEDMFGFFCCLDASLKIPNNTSSMSLCDVQRLLKKLIFTQG